MCLNLGREAKSLLFPICPYYFVVVLRLEGVHQVLQVLSVWTIGDWMDGWTDEEASLLGLFCVGL